MSRAALTAEDAPEYGPDVRRIVVDCEHATTTMHLVSPPGAPPAADAAIVQMLLLRHCEAERCRCTRSLHRRYGLTRTW